MPQRFLIIDGYNLLHAAGMAQYRYRPGELEKSRNRLLSFLVNRLSANERSRTTIVFDAAEAPYESSRRSGLEGMTVLFAGRGRDADTVIERLIEMHSAPRQIHLVSSDHRLQKAARKRRAKSVDSEVFFADLDSRDVQTDQGAEDVRSLRPTNPKFTGEVSESETELLLQIFADAEKIQDEQRAPSASMVEASTENPAAPTSSGDNSKEESDEKVADIDDTEWHKYLAEFPQDLNKLLEDDAG